MSKEGKTNAEIARFFNIGETAISRCVNRQTYANID
jgi:hypothetical protein